MLAAYALSAPDNAAAKHARRLNNNMRTVPDSAQEIGTREIVSGRPPPISRSKLRVARSRSC
eukprot:1761257-Rhodomonas_salina.1